jgi:alkaline phosphatase
MCSRLALVLATRASAVFVLALTIAVPAPARPHFPSPPAHAKNVILFLADAGGLPTLHAASLMASGGPRGLFVQSLPYIALVDTSAADGWVTDSAAGMTAIVAGRKTNNGVLGQGPDAIRGQRDGMPINSILEYAV